MSIKREYDRITRSIFKILSLSVNLKTGEGGIIAEYKFIKAKCKYN